MQSIAWINFASDVIVDLLKLFGLILNLPQALLSLTVLAWGNCLGDMSADVAMTRKGFGEMGITATVAGPVFNVLVGMGLSLTILLITYSNPRNDQVVEGRPRRSLPSSPSRAGPIFSLALTS